MGKYLELFRGEVGDLTEKTKLENKPYVAYSTKEGRVVYTVVPVKEEETEIDLTLPYVTFKAEEDGSSIELGKLSTNQMLEYSTDTTTWNIFGKWKPISLNNGDKVYVRGILSADNTSSNYTRFEMSGKIAASGNCNALWNYEDLNAPLKAYCGYMMFSDCASLTTAPELPATVLTDNCYYKMFYNCASLTTAPELPATKLVAGCYEYIFKGCTSLATAPELPATELVDECYSGMFHSCTSLTTAPSVLPATKLAKRCYSSMFNLCTSLTTVPELPATELVDECYSHMFASCTSLTTAPVLPATTLAAYCYYNMFVDCKSLITAPELPATKLANRCYQYMFNSCTAINHITCLATDISADNCTTDWVNSISNNGTFIKHPNMTNWTTEVSGIPEGWTVVDAEL